MRCHIFFPLQICDVRMLPPEIMTLVFSYLTTNELCTSVLPVCRTWYSLVWKCPRILWGHLIMPPSKGKNVRKLYRLLDMYGRHTHQIHFNNHTKRLGLNTLRSIYNRCPNLRRVSFDTCYLEEICETMHRYPKICSLVVGRACNCGFPSKSINLDLSRNTSVRLPGVNIEKLSN